MLSDQEKLSIVYHNLFEFPLNLADLVRWKFKNELVANYHRLLNVQEFSNKLGFYFLKGKNGLIYKRNLRKRISVKKMKIARRAAKILSVFPSVKMITVTGSLAMENSSENSDIDLMVVTKTGTLWLTRLFAYMVIHAFGLAARKPNDLRQKDRLCLNMWLDESDLIWKKSDRNLYTAHEIAQIVPLVNKDKTYEKFLYKNHWILDFWPNSVDKKLIAISHQRLEKKLLANYYSLITSHIEKLAFRFQYNHMKSKITREVVTPTRALFHPNDWGKIVMGKLNSTPR